MNKKIKEISFYLTAFAMVLVGCKSSENHDFESMSRDQYSIPFYLDIERMWITVGDPLLKKDQRAFMLVSIYQDKNANVLGFNLYAFTLLEDEKVVINYESEIISELPDSISEIENFIYSQEFYPAEIHPFYEYLSRYLKTIEFTKAENVEPEEVNIASFNFRLYGS